MQDKWMQDTPPLTIVQAATNLANWGGLEIHLLNLAVQLRARGHRVIIAGQPGRFVLSRAQNLGLETFEATVRRQDDFRDLARLRGFLRRENVDVIHAHSREDALVPALAARLAGVPVSVLTWHLPFPFKRRVQGNLILALLHRRLISISESVRQMHLRHGVSPRRLTVIHHGTDVSAFRTLSADPAAVRRSLTLGPDAVAVGIVGRVSPEKGHQDLLDALSHLAPLRPGLRGVVVGDGPFEAEVRTMAAERGLADRIVFAGFRDDVGDVINALDIIAVPSVWPEPCSAAIQQGMALRKPVVGTRVGGTPEMIVDGETGFLVPPSDPAALAAALGRLADDAALRQTLGAAGLARVEAHFSLHQMTDEVEALYRRELAQTRRRPR